MGRGLTKGYLLFKRRLEAHPISQGGYKILGESNREKGLATRSRLGEGQARRTRALGQEGGVSYNFAFSFVSSGGRRNK